MEFFEEIETSSLTADDLKERLSIASLPSFCQSIETVLSDNKENGTVYCVWGEHEVNREILMSGIRFSMPDCPNALAWSITSKEAGGDHKLVIHCTIATKTHDEDFIETIREFVRDWKTGLSAA